MLQVEEEDTWPFIASIIYTTVWCVSFYGQTYQNWKYKSVQGFNLDYFVLNISGYTFYTFYLSIGYFTDIPGAGTVVIADLVFVYHAVAVIIFQLYQVCIYPKGQNKISKFAVWVIIILWMIVLVTDLLYLTGVTEYYEYWNPVSVMGYCKLTITLIKYTPPAIYNFRRKSTKGWSIFNIVLDLFGGVFSMVSGGISVDNGLNLTKVILAFITIFYDLLFCFQHYVLYRHKEPILIEEKSSPETEKVLVNEGNSDEEIK